MNTPRCLLLLLLSVSPVLWAEREPVRPEARRRPNEAAVAILYDDPNFQGAAYEIYPGDEISDLREVRFRDGGKINDRISSIRVLGGLRLNIYANPRFRGDRLLVETDIPDLRRWQRPTAGEGSWDDTITAVRADPAPRRPGPEKPREQRPPHPRGPVGVILYSDPNFQGDALELEPGAELDDLRSLRFPDGSKINDRVSSIRILGGAHVTIYADPRCRGDQLLLTDDVPDLRRLQRPPPERGSWDDTITALRVGELRPGRPERGR